MMPPIIINDIKFNTQKNAIDYTRKVLSDLECIREIRTSAEGWDYLNALIKRHPQYESKKGVGIHSIIIKRNLCNHIAMDLKRNDGTTVDISWRHCVTGQSATPKQNLISAMRFAVKEQIDDFKRSVQQFPRDCEICFKPILMPKDMHIHHDTRFKELAETFIRKNGSYPTQFDDDPTTNQAKIYRSGRRIL